MFVNNSSLVFEILKLKTCKNKFKMVNVTMTTMTCAQFWFHWGHKIQGYFYPNKFYSNLHNIQWHCRIVGKLRFPLYFSTFLFNLEPFLISMYYVFECKLANTFFGDGYNLGDYIASRQLLITIYFNKQVLVVSLDFISNVS